MPPKHFLNTMPNNDKKKVCKVFSILSVSLDSFRITSITNMSDYCLLVLILHTNAY